MASCEVSIPGKVMLSGEYAVLAGGEALAATVDAQMLVRVDTMGRDVAENAAVEIHSDLWQQVWQSSRQALLHEQEHLSEPLLATVARGLELFQLPGAKITINSQLKLAYGIGSSSAMRLGVLVGMAHLHQHKVAMTNSAQLECMQQSFLLQKSQQKYASGYDVITQYCGGLVRCHPLDPSVAWPGHIESLPGAATVLRDVATVFVGTRGTPTASAVNTTMQWLNEQQLMPALQTLSNQLTAAILTHLEQLSATSWQRLLHATIRQREFFTSAPTFPHRLAEQLRQLPGCDEHWTFKTTGAGGEDALLIFAAQKNTAMTLQSMLTELGWQLAPFEFCETGMSVAWQPDQMEATA